MRILFISKKETVVKDNVSNITEALKIAKDMVEESKHTVKFYDITGLLAAIVKPKINEG
jgi:hypothetical protein